MKYTCKICNCIFSAYKVKRHIINDHNISEQEYYDTYLKTEENNCIHCGNKTPFVSMYIGYRKYCCRQCASHAGNSVEAREKARNTCLQNYGVLYPMQSKDIIKKSEKTCLEKYGDTSINRIKSIQEKQHTHEQVQKMLETYKHTCLEKYNVENTSSLPEVKMKREQTLLKNFGVKYTFQSHEIRLKSKARFISPEGKCYDSRWEYLYECYLIEHNIKYEYAPKIKFKYYFNGKEKFYFPDFLVYENDEQKIVEIKGEHLYKELLIENTQANAKYKCMLENNVIILRKQDLLNLGIKI